MTYRILRVVEGPRLDDLDDTVSVTMEVEYPDGSIWIEEIYYDTYAEAAEDCEFLEDGLIIDVDEMEWDEDE